MDFKCQRIDNPYNAILRLHGKKIDSTGELDLSVKVNAKEVYSGKTGYGASDWNIQDIM